MTKRNQTPTPTKRIFRTLVRTILGIAVALPLTVGLVGMFERYLTSTDFLRVIVFILLAMLALQVLRYIDE